MDTSRDYYEDKIADYNRYRRGRTLYQFCKDEGIDYNWMLRAQRQFGGKGNKKRKTLPDTRSTPSVSTRESSSSRSSSGLWRGIR